MKTKITKRVVDTTIPGPLDTFLWDTDVKGFGVKVTPRGSKVYLLQYRYGGRVRRYTIGKHGSPWTPDRARGEAVRLLGRIEEGVDPATEKADARREMSVAELCDQYLAEGCGTKKASTLATDRGRIERHIKPLMGRRRVSEITPNDVRRFQDDVACGKTAADERTGPRGRARVTGGRGTAARTVGLLGGIFSFSIAEGLRTDNPVRGVKRFVDARRERFLSSDELARFGDALTRSEADGENPNAIAAIRLLILTGCRKGEVLGLRWEEVDFQRGCLVLGATKTGHRIIPLGAPALELLASLTRVEGNPHVFPGVKVDGGHFVGLPKLWERVRARAELDDVRLHDLRHSFASVGAGAGMGLHIVGKLLGHRDPKTTARYAHIADHPAKAAADRIAMGIDAAMRRKSTSVG